MSHTIGWREWSDSAFEDAAAGRKPVLLSIITAWSGECAAMDALVYGDPGVASVVNERFIPVRIDADDRPDVNDRYNLGGWPTTVLLTPEGHILTGGTYLAVEEILSMLAAAADAWRDRSDELRGRSVRVLTEATDPRHPEAAPPVPQPDSSAVEWLRSLLVEQFDQLHGGFGAGPKYPHVPAMLLALALADEEPDQALRQVVEVSLDRLGALWDAEHGGFYRCADEPDWSRPSTEKTLEDNAALLVLYADASNRLESEEYRSRAGEIARWIRGTLADSRDAGFFNSQAAVTRIVDRSKYVDRNADAVSALLRAGSLFDDPWPRDFALRSLESVVVSGYVPGAGVAHRHPGGVAPARGLLCDQIRTASALIWAHVASGQLPYSMLALEVVQFAIRTMWDEPAGCFRDRTAIDPHSSIGPFAEPVMPFGLNCDAACVLDRLATITGDQTLQNRALSILGHFAAEYRAQGLSGVQYGLAMREIIHRHPPRGLELSHVDWDLEYGH